MPWSRHHPRAQDLHGLAQPSGLPVPWLPRAGPPSMASRPKVQVRKASYLGPLPMLSPSPSPLASDWLPVAKCHIH